MAQVIIALGSNLGNRLHYLQKAAHRLSEISDSKINKSSLWESEPVGNAKYSFLNGVISIETRIKPLILLKKLKDFEQQLGREKEPVRWGPRIIDLDIISYDDLVVQSNSLIIPHPEYRKRLFVLLPLREIEPSWKDPETEESIHNIINKAPLIDIEITDYNW